MTAKYGTPYFSNYINSDMEPSDVRSMAILGTQNVIYQDRFGRISKNEIRHLVSNWLNTEDKPKYNILMNGKFVPIIDMFEVSYEKYNHYVTICFNNGQSQSFSYDHKCIVVRDNQKQEILSQDVKKGDKLMIYEAIKMMNVVHAPMDGKIKEVNAKVGETLPKGALLVTFKKN